MRKYDLDETDAMDEIAADFAMTRLFFDEKTIREITKKRSKLAQAIRNILQWIKDKLHFKTSDIDRAIRLWNNAYNASRRSAKNPQVHDDVAQKKNADSDTGEGAKYSMAKMDDAQATAVLDSFNIEKSKLGDYIYVQKKVLQTLADENFFTNEEGRSRIEVNAESGMTVEINKSGIDETFNFDNYGKRGKQLKLFKLATIRLIPDVIRNGHLISSGNANIHGDQYTTKYAYIEDTVNVNGDEIFIKISVKQSAQKNKFWVHNVYINENVTGQGAGTSKSSKTPYKTDDNTDRIPQDSGIVKKNDAKKSLSGSEELMEELSVEAARTLFLFISILTRRFAGGFFEYAIEIAQSAKAAGICDLGDSGFSPKLLFRFLHAQGIDEF